MKSREQVSSNDLKQKIAFVLDVGLVILVATVYLLAALTLF